MSLRSLIACCTFAAMLLASAAAATPPQLVYSRAADALVIEATYLDRERGLAQDFGHLTARQAAELARDAEVGTLILTHLSRRYYEREVLAEAQQVFPSTYVARDFDVFQVGKGGDVRLVRDGR